MSASALSSRAIIGSFYRRLKQNSGLKWVEAISNYFQSDQDSETYNWLGQVPVMREWAGGRQAKGFTTNGLTIENKHFEATLEVPVKDLRRDKTASVSMNWLTEPIPTGHNCCQNLLSAVKALSAMTGSISLIQTMKKGNPDNRATKSPIQPKPGKHL